MGHSVMVKANKKKMLYMKLLFKSVIKMIMESQMQISIVTNIIV